MIKIIIFVVVVLVLLLIAFVGGYFVGFTACAETDWDEEEENY